MKMRVGFVLPLLLSILLIGCDEEVSSLGESDSNVDFAEDMGDIEDRDLEAQEVDQSIDGDGDLDTNQDSEVSSDDSDGDGLTDQQEAELGTDPFNSDTDNDGLSDLDEVNAGTNPLLADEDQDGLNDSEEQTFGTNPSLWDTDGDGLGDGEEIQQGTNPLVPDSDGDGITDKEEIESGTDPNSWDTDGDGLSDGEEALAGTDPFVTDTDGDLIADGLESGYGTDPTNPDTDEDGVLDGAELYVGMDPDEADLACSMDNQQAGTHSLPIDIIFVIDNSGSMDDEIETVQQNINENFASIIEESGVDYQVIVISQHGQVSTEEPCTICVSSPLSGTDCSPVPDEPVYTSRFKHFNRYVSSSSGLRRLILSFDDGMDNGVSYCQGCDGYKDWLRMEAVKIIVIVTDDKPFNPDNPDQWYPTPAEFDQEILSLTPQHFGVPGQRNYIMHTIVGVQENNPANQAYEPSDPFVTQACDTAMDVGHEWQTLAILTGGLRFPVCNHDGYDAVFQRIAQGVIDVATLECEYAIPYAPSGETIDEEAVVVQYVNSQNGEKEILVPVDGLSECTGDLQFYVENSMVYLCPSICSQVRDDEEGRLETYVNCDGACVPTGAELCFDGIDNDCDGFVDIEDADCIN